MCIESKCVRAQALEVLFWPKYHKVYGSVHSNNVVIARLASKKATF